MFLEFVQIAIINSMNHQYVTTMLHQMQTLVILFRGLRWMNGSRSAVAPKVWCSTCSTLELWEWTHSRVIDYKEWLNLRFLKCASIGFVDSVQMQCENMANFWDELTFVLIASHIFAVFRPLHLKLKGTVKENRMKKWKWMNMNEMDAIYLQSWFSGETYNCIPVITCMSIQ